VVALRQYHATTIPFETLRRRKQKLKTNPTWTPKDARWGIHRRIFTEAEEAQIASEIRQEYLLHHRRFTSDDFQTLIVDRYLQKLLNDDPVPDFVCSPTFIRAFMLRNRFSHRRQHFRRRPTAKPTDVSGWTNLLSELLRTYDHDMIINCDETAWRLYPNNILTWWETGADDVSIYVQGDEKEAVTVLATISASGVKWPLFFIAKGQTIRVEHSQIGDVGEHWRSHTPSGWMTSNTFSDYLHLLRAHALHDGVIHLILDLHSSHRTEDVKATAALLNIQLHYVPAGMTDALQPLDRVVFGALKSHARRLFRARVREEPQLRRTKQEAAQDMVSAWEMVSSETIIAGWDIYENEPWEDDPELLYVIE
jgi:hypothetical protein